MFLPFTVSFAAIFLGFAILCGIEAKLESIMIQLKNPAAINYTALNRLEHRWSAGYYMAVVLLLLIVSGVAMKLTWRMFPMAVSLLLCRRIFFETLLKVFRHRQVRNIEGDQPMDTFSRKVFGQFGGWRELGVVIGLSLAFIFLTTYKF